MTEETVTEMTRRPPRWRSLLLVFGLLAVQGLIVFLLLREEETRRRRPEASFRYEQVARRPAPEVTLARPDGSTRRLGDFRGRAVLLHFWATWCVPCRQELPGLLEAGRGWARGGGPEVIALSLDEDWEVVRQFFGGELPAEVFRDGEGTAASAYEVSALPDTYLVAPDGTLRLRFGGARSWDSETAREVLRAHAGGGR